MRILRILLVAMAAVSALGVLLSGTAHVAAVLGLATIPPWMHWTLQIGVSAVFCPAALLSWWRARDIPIEHAYCPKAQGWPRELWVSTVVTSGYALLNFVVIIATILSNPSVEPPARIGAAAYSSYQACFFLLSFMVLYSAAKGVRCD